MDERELIIFPTFWQDIENHEFPSGEEQHDHNFFRAEFLSRIGTRVDREWANIFEEEYRY
jgi:hypothetical protein